MEIKNKIIPESPTDYNAINALQALEHCDVRGGKVLVVGCNRGEDCTYFVVAGAQEVHGVDVIDEIGEKFKHEKVKYHKKSAEKMDFFPDDYFDLVYCFATMEYIPDIESTFREMARVCKKGGVVFSVASPLWYSPYGNHRDNFFKDYPWIHLCLSNTEIKEWFLKNMAEEFPEIVANIDEQIESLYADGTEVFNKKKSSEYLDACSNLGMNIITNEVEKDPSHALTEEARKNLVPLYGEDELFGVTHRFVGKKPFKFSILIATRNAAKRFPKTLDSILAQSFGDYEVVIVDGASTDGTQDIIKEYERKLGGKFKWISEPDSGLYNALNKGVKMAKGEFLNVIGAGDWLEENALEKANKCIEENLEVDAVYGKTRVWDKILSKSCILQTSPETLPSHPMQHPSLLYKKSLHDKFGIYDETYRIAADYLFCLKAFYVGGAKAVALDSVIDNFVMDGISSSNNLIVLKENYRARQEAGVSKKASFAEALNMAKKKVRNLF